MRIPMPRKLFDERYKYRLVFSGDLRRCGNCVHYAGICGQMGKRGAGDLGVDAGKGLCGLWEGRGNGF